MNINKEILKTIKYFSFFAYHPTLTEIHTFLQAKISKNELNKELVRMIKLKKILYSQIHTPPQYSIRNIKDQSASWRTKIKTSQKKLNYWRFRVYIKLISLFPQIKLVGLSGSISMMNAKEDDDIDLFIITAKNRLFTGRLISLILAQVLGLRRNREARSSNFLAPVGTLPAGNGESQVAKNFNSSPSFNNETMKQWNNHVQDKVCLNLFFDEKNLEVPKFKQTEFVGHEVLQMKPIIVKDNIYERFLEANRWVFRLFPNAEEVFSMKYKVSGIRIPNTKYLILDTISDWIESQLRKFQLRFINKHKTSEIITSTQLWFHPDDFEKKIKKFKG